MMRPMAAIAVLLLAIVGCASDPTQGYSTATTFPAGYRTVAVPIFENDTFDRDIEFELADALVKEIEQRTPYKVTASSRADTVLRGRIVEVKRDQISKSRRTGLGEEVILSVTVDFEWVDARSGQVIESRRGFTANSLFVPSQPHSEPQDYAVFAAAQRLAKDIVAEMRADW